LLLSKKELEQTTLQENFWAQKEFAYSTLQKIKQIEIKLDSLNKIDDDYDLLLFHIEIIKQQDDVSEESKLHLNSFVKSVEKLEVESLLNDKDDSRDAIINIHPGAGGKESEDWAFMLYRMYKRWSDNNSFKMKILNYQDGDDDGLKDASIEIKGNNVYGMLKSEIGVHRLVRISPYDSNSRRHTSFASVFVSPIIEDDIDFNINENDLKIDTYRASGAGGQHVNKTDSAVRIKHIPSNIVVQCQNQRSQLKNKTIALKLLKSKLYQLKIDEINSERDKLNQDKLNISWGSQIRSYVFHPYNMVKDHRTKHETSDVNKVLDGNINTFIHKYLLFKMEK
tara:strand:- start:394 stop:1407 length:1014 start_codon:yes stop_codon:yes gene_type:complete